MIALLICFCVATHAVQENAREFLQISFHKGTPSIGPRVKYAGNVFR